MIWMGPIRVMKHHDENPNSPLVEFAEVVCRDPFSLVGARPNPDFRLAELAGLRFASTSEVPTPWLCLEQDLRDAGIDPGRLDRIIGQRHGRERRGVARRQPRRGAAVRAVRRAGRGGRRRGLAAGQRARPHQLHGVRHDPRSPRRRPRAVRPHGAGDVPHPALARRRLAGGDRDRHRRLFPGGRSAAC